MATMELRPEQRLTGRRKGRLRAHLGRFGRAYFYFVVTIGLGLFGWYLQH